MSSKYEYTDEMVTQMEDNCSSGVTEAVIQSLCDDFEFPRRSVTAKLRKLGFDVPKKPGDAPTFTPEETEALKSFLEENSGVYTAEDIATDHFTGFTSRQITGKALSLEMTGHVKPAEKKVTPKTYTDDEEATIQGMVTNSAYLEEIAEKLGKPINSVRGKLLSMGLKAVQKHKKETKKDAYEGIDAHLDETVEELSERYGKTLRGVKTVLARRKLACADYTPKTVDKD